MLWKVILMGPIWLSMMTCNYTVEEVDVYPEVTECRPINHPFFGCPNGTGPYLIDNEWTCCPLMAKEKDERQESDS